MSTHPKIKRLDYDNTASSVNNFIPQEDHVIDANRIRVLSPDKGAYFTTTMKVKKNGVLLTRGSDWIAVEHSEVLARKTNKEASYFVRLKIGVLETDIITLEYQAVGGKYIHVASVLVDIYNSLDKSSVDIDHIVNMPDFFDALPHPHHANDIYGTEEIVEALDRIRSATILSNIPAYEYMLSYMLSLTSGDHGNRVYMELLQPALVNTVVNRYQKITYCLRGDINGTVKDFLHVVLDYIPGETKENLYARYVNQVTKDKGILTDNQVTELLNRGVITNHALVNLSNPNGGATTNVFYILTGRTNPATNITLVDHPTVANSYKIMLGGYYKNNDTEHGKLVTVTMEESNNGNPFSLSIEPLDVSTLPYTALKNEITDQANINSVSLLDYFYKRSDIGIHYFNLLPNVTIAGVDDHVNTLNPMHGFSSSMVRNNLRNFTVELTTNGTNAYPLTENLNDYTITVVDRETNFSMSIDVTTDDINLNRNIFNRKAHVTTLGKKFNVSNWRVNPRDNENKQFPHIHENSIEPFNKEGNNTHIDDFVRQEDMGRYHKGSDYWIRGIPKINNHQRSQFVLTVEMNPTMINGQSNDSWYGKQTIRFIYTDVTYIRDFTVSNMPTEAQITAQANNWGHTHRHYAQKGKYVFRPWKEINNVKIIDVISKKQTLFAGGITSYGTAGAPLNNKQANDVNIWNAHSVASSGSWEHSLRNEMNSSPSGTFTLSVNDYPSLAKEGLLLELSITSIISNSFTHFPEISAGNGARKTQQSISFQNFAWENGTKLGLEASEIISGNAGPGDYYHREPDNVNTTLETTTITHQFTIRTTGNDIVLAPAVITLFHYNLNSPGTMMRFWDPSVIVIDPLTGERDWFHYDNAARTAIYGTTLDYLDVSIVGTIKEDI